MRKTFAVAFCLVFGFFCKSLMYAQDYLYATGNPSFSTQIPIENGFINVNNGDIHIEIPLAQNTQRGRLQLNERLVYDSRIWRIISHSGYSWQPTNVPNSMGGWIFSSGIQSGTYTFNGFGETYVCNAGGATILNYTDYTGFQWTDPSGTVHPFPSIRTQYYDAAHLPVKCLGYSGSPVAEIPNGDGYATDGSGYHAVVSNYTTLTIYDPQGNKYNPTRSGTQPPANSAQVTDANGNYWSKDANGNLVDTLNNTPVIVTTSGNNIYYDVLGVNGSRNRYTVTTQTVYYHTAFNQTDVSESSGSFTAIQSIQLPDGSSYSFTYDSGTASGNYGELTSVTLPSGGTIQYGYTNFLDSFQNQNRWVASRVKDGATISIVPAVVTQCSKTSGCQEKVTVTSGLKDDTVYTFTLDSGAYTNASSWSTGVDYYSGLSTGAGTKVRSISSSYTFTSFSVSVLENGTSNTVIGQYQVPNSITTTTTLPDIGLTSQVVTTLDMTYARPSTTKQWDFYSSSSGAPSSPMVETDYTYNYLAQNTRYLSVVTTKDGAGNMISQATYEYDKGDAPKQIAGLPQHNTFTGVRGNLTNIHEWLNTTGSTLDTTMVYDDTGALLSKTDPNGTTSFGYDSTNTFPTSTTMPTPSSGVALASTASYDVSTGLLNSTTDPNGKQTVYSSYDSFGRATEIDDEDSNGTIIGKKTADYWKPYGYSVYRYQNGSTRASDGFFNDPYGRKSRSASANGQASNPWDQQDICYDGNGQVSFRSYTYQGNAWSTPKVCSGAGDSYTHDALGRIKKISHSDGTSTQYSYTGRATQITDESGVSRIIQSDGLGRVSAVCEISSNLSMPSSGSPQSCGLDIAGTGFLTTYSYDLANHKTTITQGDQTRIFQTDSLGRLVYNFEPESSVTTYSYSYNTTGLQVTRKRPRANQTDSNTLTTTTTQYDSLGRVVSVSYDDGTPGMGYLYDVSSMSGSGFPFANSKGRLVYATRNNSSMMQLQYDPMGRVTRTLQCLPGLCGQSAQDKWISYSYDWEGNLLSEDDAAGVTTSYGYSVGNQITSITRSPSDSTHPGTLMSNVQYGAFGPTSYSMGNGLSVAKTYDALGRNNGGWLCSASSQPYCTSGTQLYGYSLSWQGSRVTAACDTVLNRCANFGYDEFNRLTSQTISSGTAQNFTWVYDRYGNRWQQNALQNGPAPQLHFSTTTNRVDFGYTYDAAGNEISDGVNSYRYDPEGNQVQQIYSGTTSYTYDAFNQQVRTDYPSGSAVLNAFNVSGQLASTWFLNGGSVSQVLGKSYWGSTPYESYVPSQNKSYFQFRDWIGSLRGVTDNAGTITDLRFSLPFGDGAANTSGSRDNTFDGFTGFWDGGSSATNHAPYREYANVVGRWMAPDPYSGSYDFTNPQSFNRYAYVMNNPLAFNDPSGLVTQGPASYCGTNCPTDGGGNDFIDLFVDIGRALASLFGGGPSFHGTLKARPSTGAPNWGNDPGSFGESLGLPVNGPSLNTGLASLLGLPDAGCEFGACGPGVSGFRQGYTPGTTSWTMPTFSQSMLELLLGVNWADRNGRLFGTHYCGKGGSGQTVNDLDRACYAHDACYAAYGLNYSDNFSLTLSFSKSEALKACNQNLCNSARQLSTAGASEVNKFFTYGGGGFYGCSK